MAMLSDYPANPATAFRRGQNDEWKLDKAVGNVKNDSPVLI